MYTISKYTSPTTALRGAYTSDSTGTITSTALISNDTSFYWSILVFMNGICLVSEIMDDNDNYMSVFCSGSVFSLSSEDVTTLALINVSDYTPCTSFSFEDYYVDVGQIIQIQFETIVPSTASCVEIDWFTFEINNTNIFTFDYPYIYGLSPGTATVTVTHKLAHVSTDFDITVHTPYTLSVTHYYDQGYSVRFSDNGIISYQNVCSEIFHRLFGIDTSVTVSSYTSCADTCTGLPVTLQLTKNSCNHIDCAHKTRAGLRNEIVSQFGAGTSTNIKTSWTGHVLESISSNSSSTTHTIVMTIGMVTNSSHDNLSESKIRQERIYTLLHELSHQLGAPDHYCYDETSNNCNNPTNDCWRCDRGLTEPPECLMTSRMSDLESKLNNGNLDTIYCSQCMSSTHSKGIFTHLNNHH